MGNTPSSYQQNEKSYKMFPGNKKSLSVRSNSLEATPRTLLLILSTKNVVVVFFFFVPRCCLTWLSLKWFKNNSTSVPAFIFDRSSRFSLSICTEEVCDSCLSDWTFQVFHLQFACHVAKLILTHFHVDAFLVNCTHCLFALQFERNVTRGRDSKWETWIFRQVYCSFEGAKTHEIPAFLCLIS